MKVKSKFLLGINATAMAIAFAACSSDEPVVNPGTPETPDGDVAYMAITISAPEGIGTRSTTDGGYEASWSTDAEHEVNTVDFYFFEEDGAYAFKASADGNFAQNGDDKTANVEYIGQKNILILNGVRTNDYPEYVVTVLNAPSDFTPGQTLQETADKLATYANDFTESRKDGAFVMTTSSFYGEVAAAGGNQGELRHDNTMYFATKLNPSDFKTTAEAASTTTNPVAIYVERLGAKVQLKMSEELADKYEEYNGETYYKLSQTLAGGNNMTEGDDMSDVTLYVKVVGWGLNATAKQSYMSKKLPSAWNTTATEPWDGWNKTADWRSFWAQAYTYDISGDNNSEKLTYASAKDIAESQLATLDDKKTPNYTYCYENTNIPSNIFAEVDGGSLLLNTKKVAVKNALVTHAVLHTQIFEKKDGKFVSPGQLVQYRGILYTGESYKNLLLNRLKQENKLNFWVKVSSTTGEDETVKDEYKTIDASYLVINRSTATGHKLGEIVVSADATKTEDVYYYFVAASGTEGDDDYVAAHYEKYKDAKAFQDALNAALEEVVDTNNPAVGSDANADAFYYIPIEHRVLTEEEVNAKAAVEGYYGVVRNHWYRLTVKSFKKVGHLVFTPSTDETEIIPEGPEDPLYYVGANINILSWKVVNQTISDL